MCACDGFVRVHVLVVRRKIFKSFFCRKLLMWSWLLSNLLRNILYLVGLLLCLFMWKVMVLSIRSNWTLPVRQFLYGAQLSVSGHSDVDSRCHVFGQAEKVLQ